jgi:ParB-like nuclease domain
VRAHASGVFPEDASHARNARTHSAEQVDQLVASIREWGWTTPVLLDEAGGIIAGHGRVLAAKSSASPTCRAWWRSVGPRRSERPTSSRTISSRSAGIRTRLGIGERAEGQRQSSKDLHSLRRWHIAKCRDALNAGSQGFTMYTVADNVGQREGRAGAVDDETIRGAGNHGGKGGLRNGGEAAACLTVTTAASPALRPSDARGG